MQQIIPRIADKKKRMIRMKLGFRELRHNWKKYLLIIFANRDHCFPDDVHGAISVRSGQGAGTSSVVRHRKYAGRSLYISVC